MINMKQVSLFLLCFLASLFANAQNSTLISGPWAGNVELRTATIWLEVSPQVKSVSINYYDTAQPKKMAAAVYKGILGQPFNPLKIELNGLQMATTYQYEVIIDGKSVKVPFNTRFTTKDLWQWRKPAPDFSFLTGSCAYFNEPEFDRPGKPYGGDLTIFETMATTPAQFHLWLGDNWYTREVDYSSAWGLNYRASHDRAIPSLQALMASMPQYAIWDDHDYGPNDAGKSYIFKQDSRRVFNSYFLNPTAGENEQGIYTQFSYGDVDFFLTDDRYFRAEEDLVDSINGQPNFEKTYFGPQQLSWLKNALLFSRATFKVIVTGSQLLNPLNKYECMQHYPYEYNELMSFLKSQKINGVLFLTGDRHHSEVIRMNRDDAYPLFDITVSPYTSGVSKASGQEATNPFREPGTLVETQNFGHISVSGIKNERELKINFLGTKGETLGTWKVSEKELKY